jgi:hypothetical protein
MATVNQISFLKLNSEIIKEPILIVGSKIYDYDSENIKKRLEESGFKNITGIDLFDGDGVDFTADIVDTEDEFIKKHKDYFATVICMEILTNVKNPFLAADNVISMLKEGGAAVLSECYVRKISKMPVDLWRFTYDGTKVLFSGLEFDDSKAKLSLTREKSENLLPLKYPLPQVLSEKHTDESSIGYFVRRLHRKYFAGGIFRISRLFPEITIYSIGSKPKSI